MNYNNTDTYKPILSYSYDAYYYVHHYNADQRVKDWPLMSSPLPSLIAVFVYLYVCLWLGPRFMQNRKPFKLKRVLALYNIFQVAFSFWIFSMAIRGGWFTGYSFVCQELDLSTDAKPMMMANMMWWYYISKFVDFLDTVFFVLRKKYDQISFLHVGHHGGMPYFCWYGVKFLAGGHITMLPLLNSFVHTIMYSYYFLSGLGSTVQKYLWWKKYLTLMQMVQFVLMFLHQFQLLFNDCNFPRFHIFWGCIFGPWILILFHSFYRQSYSSKNDIYKNNNNVAMEKKSQY